MAGCTAAGEHRDEYDSARSGVYANIPNAR